MLHERAKEVQEAYRKTVELVLALLDVINAYAKFLLRKIKHLPHLVSGTNPYAFSSEGGIKQSMYSKAQVYLFGWAALLVVAYVTAASLKIVETYNLAPKGEWLGYTFSAVFGVIVFFCDRIILSYPKIQITGWDIHQLIGIQNASDLKTKALRRVAYALSKFFRFKWCARLFFSVFRILLALVISCLLVSTMLLSMNEQQVNQRFQVNQIKQIGELLRGKPLFSQYEYALRVERLKYFQQYAIATCREIAAQGVRERADGVNIAVPATDAIMADAPKGSFGAAERPYPDAYICGISDAAPCRAGVCPEYDRLSKKLPVAVQEFVVATNNRTAAEARLVASNEFKQAEESARKADFGAKIAALVAVYRDKSSESLYGELGIAGPLLVLLLTFELLPAFAKMFFPARRCRHKVV